MKCKECGDLLGESMFDYDNFCFLCVLGIMAGGSGSPNYEEASGEYWQEQIEQNALDYPPFWKTPIDPA
tara:strand:- start:65 stop:271 length:207 start_codon:yes stop_codon:yes gene_type:complete